MSSLAIAAIGAVVLLGLVQLGFWLVGEPCWWLKDEDEP